MSYIAFRISSSVVSPLTYDNGLASSVQRSYETLTPKVYKHNRTKDEGVLLNGRIFSHLLYERKELDVIISADEIDSTDVAFFEEFLSCSHKYISVYNGVSWSDYFRIETEGGRTPIEYVEGVEDLPEITLTLRKIEVE